MDRSTPTSPEFDVSAALEDAEGRELVERIHDPANPRLARNRTNIYVSGRGYGKTAMSKEWVELGAATEIEWVDVAPELPTMMPTPLPASVEMTIENVSEEFYRLLFGATRAEMQEMARKRQELVDFAAGWRAAPPLGTAPAVGEVRWGCKPPTAPVYPPGSNGWYHEIGTRILEGKITMDQAIEEAKAAL